MRNEFLASVAHDLTNPLTSIQGFAALAQRLTDRGDAMPLDRLRVSLRTIERRFTGTGIGLFSVRQIVDLHGETVTIESTEGRGSTFTVALPL